MYKLLASLSGGARINRARTPLVLQPPKVQWRNSGKCHNANLKGQPGYQNTRTLRCAAIPSAFALSS